MADIAASILAKLRNKAKTAGISYQQCLQLFMQEEGFLRYLLFGFLFMLSHQIILQTIYFLPLRFQCGLWPIRFSAFLWFCSAPGKQTGIPGAFWHTFSLTQILLLSGSYFLTGIEVCQCQKTPGRSSVFYPFDSASCFWREWISASCDSHFFNSFSYSFL